LNDFEDPKVGEWTPGRAWDRRLGGGLDGKLGKNGQLGPP